MRLGELLSPANAADMAAPGPCCGVIGGEVFGQHLALRLADGEAVEHVSASVKRRLSIASRKSATPLPLRPSAEPAAGSWRLVARLAGAGSGAALTVGMASRSPRGGGWVGCAVVRSIGARRRARARRAQGAHRRSLR